MVLPWEIIIYLPSDSEIKCESSDTFILLELQGFAAQFRRECITLT